MALPGRLLGCVLSRRSVCCTGGISVRKRGGRWYGGCLPRLQRVAIATACCAAIVPSSALAQDAEVDRDSPAAREYVIPLEGARRDAAPATRNGDRRPAPGGRSGSAAPFGAGITPSVGATSGSGGGDDEDRGARGGGGEDGQSGNGTGDGRNGSSDRSDRDSSDRSSRGETTSDLSLTPGAQRPGVLAKEGGGVGESALALGIAGCVVAAGVLLGFAARRRRAS